MNIHLARNAAGDAVLIVDGRQIAAILDDGPDHD